MEKGDDRSTHLGIGDIRIGMSLCRKTDRFPMRVTGIFEDEDGGTVYLDFDGNEGDVWESRVGDLMPAEGESVSGRGGLTADDIAQVFEAEDRIQERLKAVIKSGAKVSKAEYCAMVLEKVTEMRGGKTSHSARRQRTSFRNENPKQP